MSVERPLTKQITIVQGERIEEVLRRAVRHALLEHKRARNTIATWKDGEVILIPAEEIQIEDDDNQRPEGKV